VLGIDVVAIALGTAVAKAACGIWLGDNKFGTELGTTMIDLVGKRLSTREERQYRRVWERAAEEVADRIEPLVTHEFHGLPENERLAATEAARLTFDIVALTEADLFAQDLDAGYLCRHLRTQDPDRIRVAGLSAAGGDLYNLLLRECCSYAVEIARTLPQAGVTGVTELLRRERQILDDLHNVLDRLPARRGQADFERDYRQLVANRLDKIEFFGATVTESSRRYPLSVAYLNLMVSGDFVIRRPDALSEPSERAGGVRTPVARVNDVLATTSRLFVRGQAGLGKTTLLQWIAVHSARGTFGDRLDDWNGTVPFFVPLRRHAGGELPSPEQFLTEVGRHISDEKPQGWVQQQLRAGRGLVLVDGVDELPEDRRNDAQHWLQELVSAFPSARFVVTSRPAAVPTDWLGQENFDVVELAPMTPADVPIFVMRWHEAMRKQCSFPDERILLGEYELQLLDSVAAHRDLRQLASYPLLCALLCALHRDRRGHLPSNRMELYEVALHMLLERRDQERSVDTPLSLSRTDKSLLLRDIAYWLIRNGWSSAPADRVRSRIETKLRTMVQITSTPADVYRELLERSGLIREQVEGETDFVHRSFQEYLAAAEAVAVDDIGVLVANAHTDVWTDVVVMAAGHASTARRADLLGGLLDRGAHEVKSAVRDALRLVAVACLETSPELPSDLRKDIENAATTLLPPRTMTAAKALSRTGGFTLDLLVRSRPAAVEEIAATIRAIAEIGDPASLPFLARFGRDRRRSVTKELLRAWPQFDYEEYARVVLVEFPLPRGHLEISEPGLTRGLPHIRALRQLYSTYEHSRIGLEFLPRVPQLTHLITQELSITTLEPVANSSLEAISLNNGSADLPPLDLTSLAAAESLEEIKIWSRPVANVGSITRLPRLRGLRLDHLGTLEAVDELSTLTDLSELGIGNIADLTNLRPLAFLRAPSVIGVNNCPIVEDLGYLERWSESLTGLSLRSLDDLDLHALSGLHSLSFLDVQGSNVRGFAALRDLPEVEEVWLSHDRADLGELRDIAHVRLGVTGPARSTVDLTSLAGRSGVRITVHRAINVIGADLLGKGSSVRRW